MAVLIILIVIIAIGFAHEQGQRSKMDNEERQRFDQRNAYDRWEA